MNSKYFLIPLILMFIGISAFYAMADYRVPANASVAVAYPFDENTGTTAHDRGGNGWDAGMTGTSNPAWGSGVYDTAIVFTDNQDQRLTINDTALIDIDSSITMMMWINTSGTDCALFDNYYAASPSGHYWKLTSGVPNWYNKDDGGWDAADSAVNDGTWHHIALVYNKTASQVTWYLDGDADGTDANAATLSIPSGSMTKTIGWSATFDEDWGGMIDEFKFFNASLTEEQVEFEMNTSIYYTPAPPAGGDNNVTLSYPTNTTYTSYTLDFNYTPIFYNGAIINCTSQVIGLSDIENQSAVANNSLNTISRTFDYDASYQSRIKCFNATGEYFNSNEINFTINAPEVLNINLDAPANNSEQSQYANFTFNGTLNCTSGVCGNVYVFPQYSSGTTSSTFADDTGDEWYAGTFYAQTMNRSNTLGMVGNFSSMRKEANNPVVRYSGNNSEWHGNGVWWGTALWNPDKNIYEGYFMVTNITPGDLIYVISYFNTSIPANNWTTALSPFMLYNASNAWEDTAVFTPMFARYNSTFTQGFYEGSGVTNWADAKSGWLTFNDSLSSSYFSIPADNPYVNHTFPTNCNANTSNVQNIGGVYWWQEGDTYFGITWCPSTSPHYTLMIFNWTDWDDRGTYQPMNNDYAIVTGGTLSQTEVHPSGLISIPYNSTHNTYFMMATAYPTHTQVWNLESKFTKINWGIITSSALPTSGSGVWDYRRQGGHFLTDPYLHPYQNFTATKDIMWMYSGIPTVSEINQQWGIAYPSYNVVPAYYLSSLKDGSSPLANWTSVDITNTTCVGCSVKWQLLYSNNTTTFETTPYYANDNSTLGITARYMQYMLNFTGNATYFPEVSSMILGYGNGSADMGTGDFVTNVPYDCGVLNHTNQGCEWTFTVNASSPGAYNIYVIANSTEVENTSSMINMTVIGPAEVHLALNGTEGNKTYTYPTATNATGWVTTPSGVNGNLYRNGTNITAETEVVTLPAGVWNYTFNYSSAIYTLNEVWYLANVTQGSPTLDITFNASSPQVADGAILVSCDYPAQLSTGLYNDTHGISKPYIWNVSDYSSGTYNFTCNTTGNGNYTSGTVSESFQLLEGGQLIIFRVYDENNVSQELYFDVEVFNTTFSETDENVTTFSTDIVSDVTVVISAEGYGTRYYYVNVEGLDTYNMTGYLVNDTGGQDVTFTVKNYYDQLQQGALINISRLLPEWELVAQGIMDAAGIFTIPMDPDANYKLTVEKADYDTVTREQTFPLTSYTIYLQGGYVEQPSYWTFYSSLYTNCTFDNTSRLLNCSWADSSSHVTNTSLEVLTFNSTGHTWTLCSNSSANSSGEFLCNFSLPNNQTFLWNMLIETANESSAIPVEAGSWSDALAGGALELTGIVISMLLIIFAGSIGIQTGNPAITIVMTVLGVGASMALGFLELGTAWVTILIGFAVSAGVLVHKMRSDNG